MKTPAKDTSISRIHPKRQKKWGAWQRRKKLQYSTSDDASSGDDFLESRPLFKITGHTPWNNHPDAKIKNQSINSNNVNQHKPIDVPKIVTPKVMVRNSGKDLNIYNPTRDGQDLQPFRLCLCPP